ncbi:MAG: nitroreductase family protein [Lentisphaerae bacterium]|nr:nitroreductase family protein [Lentisphaerota bacterium]
MTMKELARKSRTIRRFDQTNRLTDKFLASLVDTARITPSGSNKQTLRYRIVSSPEECATVFPHLAWAAALKDWTGPSEGERPAGYIIIASESDRAIDIGIAAQTIQLAATEQGYGACMLGTIKRDEIKKALNIPDPLNVKLVVALGKPVEKVVLEEARPGDNLNYYRTEDGVHHVPKLRLQDVLIK